MTRCNLPTLEERAEKLVLDWWRNEWFSERDKIRCVGALVNVLREAYEEGRDQGIEEAAELCRRKYLCGDPAHDERWCARCSAFQDQAGMLEDEILDLKHPRPKGEKA